MKRFNKPIRLLLLTSAFFVIPEGRQAFADEPRTVVPTAIPKPLDPNGPVPLAAENSDIPTDPAVTWGVLDCGMRYAILPNPEPKGRLSLRLHVDAGSLVETEKQRGIAHFLEHMAFNGTENFIPGEMVKYFQRLGMDFGVHTNAHTSFAETVYKLELPTIEEKTLHDSFTLLRDFAAGMKFPEAEIERERGVILSEKRAGDSVAARTSEALLKFALPEHRISSRDPIGINEVITGVSRDQFVDFYNTWYTPNRMVLIAVGDTDVATIQAQIEKHFGDLPRRVKAPLPELGKVSNRGLSAHYHFEKESGQTSLIFEKLTAPDPADNLASNGKLLRRVIATMIVNNRFERITKQEGLPITFGGMAENDILDIARENAVRVGCKPENWEAALKLMEQELRRTLEFGFTPSEFNETRANLLNYFQSTSEQANTRISADLANQISSTIGKRKVFTHPKYDFEWAQKELAAITAEDCLGSIREIWGGEGEMLLIMSGNARIENAEARLTSVFQESSRVAVTAPEEKAAVVFAYATLPEAGKIIEQKEIIDLGVTQIRFANNVRVNLKVTDFEDETIVVKARIGGGRLTEPTDKPGLGTFLGKTFLSGGLEAHDMADLERFIAGKSVGFNFAVDNDAFTFTGGTNSRDFYEQLQVMRAYLTHPGFRKESANQFLGSLDAGYQYFDGSVEGIFESKVDAFLHGGDSRFGVPGRDILSRRTLEEARAWLEPELKSGYLEITVVGDFDQAEAIKKLAATFGSLPARAAEKPAYQAERVVNFPAGGIKKFTFPTEIPKAQIQVAWPTVDFFDFKRKNRLVALGAVVNDRLREKVREELGDSYSPSAGNDSSGTWTNYGTLSAVVTVDPAQSEAVAKVVTEIARELSRGNDITPDELDRALKPILGSLEEMFRTNAYWLNGVLQSSQENPKRLEWARQMLDDIKATTVGEVNALAAEFLKADRQVTVIIKPTQPASPQPTVEVSQIDTKPSDTVAAALPKPDPIAALIRFLQENAIQPQNAAGSGSEAN